MNEKKDLSYYYADGKRVPLTPEPGVLAVDIDLMRLKSLSVHERTRLMKSARQLRRNVYLFTASDLTTEMRKTLADCGKVQPVYRHDDTMIVVLPEVRAVEGPESGSIEEFGVAHHERLRIKKQRGEQFTIVPVSGDGDDALAIANDMFEQLKLEMAQPRFLRILRRKS